MIIGEYRGEPFEAVDLESFLAVIDLRMFDLIRKIGIYGLSDSDPDDVKEQTLKTIYDYIAAIEDLLHERFDANSPSS